MDDIHNKNQTIKLKVTNFSVIDCLPISDISRLLIGIDCYRSISIIVDFFIYLFIYLFIYFFGWNRSAHVEATILKMVRKAVLINLHEHFPPKKQ